MSCLYYEGLFVSIRNRRVRVRVGGLFVSIRNRRVRVRVRVRHLSEDIPTKEKCR